MDQPAVLQVIPYLSYDGHAEEALETYKGIFEVEVVRLSRYGPKMAVSEEQQQKILHAEVKLDGNVVMLSDCFEGSLSQQHQLISLVLNYTDINKAKKTYEVLTDNGCITKPLEDNSEKPQTAEFKDKYGISWSLHCEAPGQTSPVK